MAQKVGTGKRFRSRSAQLAGKGARNPAGLAAYIGRKKYGDKRFNELARAGRERAEEQRAEQAKQPPPAPSRRTRV